MTLFPRVNRPPVPAPASAARRRTLASGPLVRLASAGAVLAVCGAGFLATSGTASATITASSWDEVPNGQVVTFINFETGYAAEDPGFSDTYPTQMDQWAPNGVDGSPASGANQAWTLVPLGGYNYNIVNRYNGMCLDDANNSTQAGNPVIQWPCNGGANQEWEVASTDGTSPLINVLSGDVVEQASTGEGAQLVQEPYNPFDNDQIWNVVPTQYDLLTAAITVAGGIIRYDNNTYSCQAGYHFLPNTAQDYQWWQQGNDYYPYSTGEGQIDDPGAVLSYTQWAPTAKGNYPTNGVQLNGPGYYHATTPYDQMGQSMLYCVSNADTTHENSTDAEDQTGGLGE
jgi:hypothetical protein